MFFRTTNDNLWMIFYDFGPNAANSVARNAGIPKHNLCIIQRFNALFVPIQPNPTTPSLAHGLPKHLPTSRLTS